MKITCIDCISVEYESKQQYKHIETGELDISVLTFVICQTIIFP